MFQLYGYSGSHQGQRIPLDRPVTVLGRDETCDIVLGGNHPIESRIISRQHARILRHENGCVMEDGDGHGKPSLQQTFVNDEAIPFPDCVVLRHRDVIRICNSTFIFYDDTVDASVNEPGILQSSPSDFLGRWDVFAIWDPYETEIEPVAQESFFEFHPTGGGEFLFAGLRGTLTIVPPDFLTNRSGAGLEWTWEGLRVLEPDAPHAAWHPQTWGTLREDGDSHNFAGRGSASLRNHILLEGQMFETGFRARRRAY